jgi:RNA polymerase sigma-70 factor (ECF subfamily)
MTNASAFDEAELMRRLRARDQAALGELYDRYGRLVYGLSLRILGNDGRLAEESTQDTFMRVWTQAEAWDPNKGRFATWLLTITRRTAIDLLRKEKLPIRSTAVAIDDLAESLGDQSIVDDPLWSNGLLIQKLLRQLPDEQRQVIQLAFYAGLSHSQIAEQLNVPLGTVKTRVRLGLQKLRDLWIASTGQQT